MKEPKITVIIPTRARCDVLQKALLTVINQNYSRLEVVVSDNCSGDGTEDVVRGLRDHRVRYLNTGRRISMAKNYEFALSHVDEGWVTIIGDDDGLMPASIRRVAEIIAETDAKAIRSNVCTYVWPSVLGKEHGRLAVPLRSGYEVRDSRIWLKRVTDGHAAYPQLPMLYYGGFVNMDVVNAIKQRSGSFYLSCIPDVYSAVSIASTIDKYIYCHEPLCINGSSRHSTGTSQFSSNPTLISSPARMFASEPNIPFHAAMPLCSDGSYPPSLHAMFYESYLQSACLRDGPARNFHAKALMIVLATSARRDNRLDDWGKLFADEHSLDFEAIRTLARRSRIRFKANFLLQRIFAAVNSFSIGSPECPIIDVYEASIAGGALRSIGVGRIKSVRRLLRRVLEAPELGRLYLR